LHLITLNYSSTHTGTHTHTHPLGLPWKKVQLVTLPYEVLFQHNLGENEGSRGTTLTTDSFSESFDKVIFRTRVASYLLA